MARIRRAMIGSELRSRGIEQALLEERRMRMKALAALLAFALAGCAAQPSAPNGNERFVTTVGTPFFVALKAPFCIATVAIAAPLAGVSGFAPIERARQLRRDLDDGLTQNCGPPYVLTP
jgi:hypothetical protein